MRAIKKTVFLLSYNNMGISSRNNIRKADKDVKPMHQLAFFDGMPKILDILACPQCRSGLAPGAKLFVCNACGVSYPVIHEILDARLPEHRKKAELADWSEHWSGEHQGRISQKFFSFWRKAVFARTVRYFLNRYFPAAGVFVEAGSGTAETSIRINKYGGERLLVAVDIVLPVLSLCPPVMDARICADIFRLPFRSNSVDGIWNLGVMEHFTHEQIDQVLREFHRILKPKGRVILFWPGKDSVPQKMLKVVEKIINLKKRQREFHFHPDEISQIASMRQGREILARNGFIPLFIDYGFRSLMAFKTLVGEKC